MPLSEYRVVGPSVLLPDRALAALPMSGRSSAQRGGDTLLTASEREPDRVMWRCETKDRNRGNSGHPDLTSRHHPRTSFEQGPCFRLCSYLEGGVLGSGAFPLGPRFG